MLHTSSTLLRSACIAMALILSTALAIPDAHADDCATVTEGDYTALANALAQLQSRNLARNGHLQPWSAGWPAYPDSAYLHGITSTSTLRDAMTAAINSVVPISFGTSFLNLTDSAHDPFLHDDVTPTPTTLADFETGVSACSCTGSTDLTNWCKIRRYIANLNARLDSHLSAIDATSITATPTAVAQGYVGSSTICYSTGLLAANAAFSNVHASGVVYNFSSTGVLGAHGDRIQFVSCSPGVAANLEATSVQSVIALPALNGEARLRLTTGLYASGNTTPISSDTTNLIVPLSPSSTTLFPFGSLGYARAIPSDETFGADVSRGISTTAKIFLRVSGFPALDVEGALNGPYSGSGIATNSAYGELGTGGYAGGQANASGANPITCNPVALATGHKIERAVDLSVAVAGPDFELVREYTSDPTYHNSTGGSIIGAGWSLNTNLYLRAEANGTYPVKLSLEGFPLSQRLDFSPDPAHSGTWNVGGPTTQTLTQLPVPIEFDGVTHHVVRLEEPGGWTKDFECNETISSGDILYLIREADEYGNTRIYRWDTSGVRRLHRIYLNGTPGSSTVVGRPAEAEIRFTWISPGLTDQGKLSKVDVVRFDPQTHAATTVQRVEYLYFSGSSPTMSPEVGTAGDLVQVTRQTILSDSTAGTFSTYYPEVTQYRYHTATLTAGSPDGNLYGDNHQLKAVLLPAEVEYASFRYLKDHGGTVNQSSVPTYAATMLTLGDSASITSASDSNESPGTLDLKNVFSKLLGYETSGSKRVATQFSLTGGCACSGAKLSYAYSETGTNPYRKTITITESKSDGSGYSAYRATKHMLSALDESHSADVYFEKEMNIYAGGASSGNAWTTTYEYDSNGQLAIETAPSGLQHHYRYADNRLVAVGIKESSADPKWIEQTVYGSTGTNVPGEDQTRTWLPTKVVRIRAASPSANPPAISGYSANDIEVTSFKYWFHVARATTGGLTSTDAVSIVDKVAERELVEENGPGGSTHEVEFFNQRGLNIWSRAADGALTHRQFDPSTGVLTMLVANANPAEGAAYNGNRYIGLSRTPISGMQSVVASGVGLGGNFTMAHGPAGAATPHIDGDLTTRYTVDKMGRVTETFTPGGSVADGYAAGVKTWTERVMRAASDRGTTSHAGVLYYAEIHHPASDTVGSDTVYSGPVTCSVMTANGQVINCDSYDAATYGTSGQTLQSRSVSFLNAARKPITERLASRVSGDSVASGAWDISAYSYDTLGRLAAQTSPNGTLREFTYDVRDRIKSESTGVAGVGSHVTTNYYYDTDLHSNTDSFGDGNLTLIVTHPTNSSDFDRFTHRLFDARNRLVSSITSSTTISLQPFSFTTYDDLDRPVSTALYSTEPTSASSPPSVSTRGKYTVTMYGQRGLPFRVKTAIVPSASSPTFLQSDTWYDDAGRAVAELAPTGPSTKRVFDGLGRAILTVVTDHAGDPAAGESSNYPSAASLILSGTTDDRVLEETIVTYAHFDEANAGVPLFVQTLKRPHDATTTGLLTPSNAVATYSGYVYDSFNRQTHKMELGTNSTAETGVLRAGGEQPGTALSADEPSPTNSKLIVKSVYGKRGLIEHAVDPMGISTWFTYDARNRVVGSVENSATQVTLTYSSGSWAPSSISEGVRISSTSYDPSGHVSRRVAFNRGSGGTPEAHTTEYHYDTTADEDPDAKLLSKDTLASIDYPHTSGTNTVKMSYNWIGEVVASFDQNMTRHAYTHDAFGRVTIDEVTAYGGSIDTSVKQIVTAYDTFGRRSAVSSKNSGGTTVNEVTFVYTALWQISELNQDPDGPIDSNAHTVSYSYETQPFSTSTTSPSNFSRLYQETYPDGQPYQCNYHIYDASNNYWPDGYISRLTGYLQDDGPGLFTSYAYLGLSTVVGVDNATPDMQLDYTLDRSNFTRRFGGPQTGVAGRYPGFDQFGRVKRQAWVDGNFTASGSHPTVPEIFDETYTYDNNSNRTARSDDRWGVKRTIHAEHFGYDSLNRLTEATRNPLSGSGSFQPYESWTLDALANWSSFGHDESGDQTIGSGESATRSFNAASDLINVNSATVTNYDNGMLKQIGRPSGSSKDRFTYDAWGRLTKHEILNGSDSPTGTNLYTYNGLGWRITQTTKNASNVVTESRSFVYDAEWRLIQEYVQQGSKTQVLKEFYGARGPDDLICRRVRYTPIAEIETPSAPAPDPVETDYYHITDAQGSSRAMMSWLSKSPVAERTDYDAYGRPFHRWAGSVAHDTAAAVNDDDRDFLKALRTNTVSDSEYDPDCDLNRDGVIDDTDLDILDTQLGLAGLDPWRIGGTEIDAKGDSMPWNSFGFCGYVYAPEAARYCVRNRWYDAGPSLAMGRWLQRDPAGYVDGMNLFEYCASGPTGASDPMGLDATWLTGALGIRDTFVGNLIDDTADSLSVNFGILDQHEDRGLVDDLREVGRFLSGASSLQNAADQLSLDNMQGRNWLSELRIDPSRASQWCNGYLDERSITLGTTELGDDLAVQNYNALSSIVPVGAIGSGGGRLLGRIPGGGTINSLGANAATALASRLPASIVRAAARPIGGVVGEIGDALSRPIGANSRAFATTRVASGEFRVSLSSDSETFIHGTVSGRNLHIENINVSVELQGQKLSTQLYRQLLRNTGRIDSISGQMMGTNRAVINSAIDEGFSAQSAAEMTPAARAASAMGYSSHSYNEASRILRSTRPGSR